MILRTNQGEAMRKQLLAGVVGLGLLTGCSDPPPINEARRIDQPQQQAAPEIKTPGKPLQSDPAAAQLLKDALAAHTGGKPELLAKLKSSYVVRGGQMEQPTGRMRSVWKTHSVWPDKYRVTMEMHSTAVSSMTFARGTNGAWQYPGGPDKLEKAPLAAEFLSTLIYQQKEDALTLLFGLAEPGVIVANGTDEVIDGIELINLQVWNAGPDYALVGLDKKTKLVKRIVYNGRESATVVVKELVFTAYQEIDGIKFGSKMIVKGAGRPLAEWNELSIDSTKPIDNKLFDGP
jgi:hypothetical protein